ncbi:MAG: electron transfer flavoprotein subunit alpha/FixB family protein [Chloroflexi bacterium]|nr:electron transfer flavoprotein subunit alpha/FixB family protein [Chloroflexota bacterium]
MPKVLIAGEVQDGKLAGVSGELVAAALKLTGNPRDVSIALACDDAAGSAENALACGVGSVYVIEHPALKGAGQGGFDAPVTAFVALLNAEKPDVFLMARTDFGYNVAPRVAFRLGVPVAQDCIDLAWDAASNAAVVTRPVYGGNAMAVYRFKEQRPQIVIVRPKTFEPAASNLSPVGEIKRFGVEIPDSHSRARLVESVKEQRAGVRLEEAQVVVAGGRGLGGPEPFKQLQDLASVLGGALGASRAACDAGWIDHSHQIGLTGKSIGPRVYITVGISGASQHMAGCSGAKTIVAINRDPDANIFKEARYGVVGDWQKILPAFIETVREIKRS